MKSRWCSCVLVTLLIIGFQPFSAAAQDEQCLEIWEFWSNEVRHEVNLETGTVTSYEAPDYNSNYGQIESLDGHYTATLEQEERGLLTLTDNGVGVSVVLSEIAVSMPYWSSDNVWLGYIEWDRSVSDTDVQSLTLYNADTGERVSHILEAEPLSIPSVEWSPDGSQIALAQVTDYYNYASTVRVYSAPDLTLTHTFATEVESAEMQWSPDGNYLAVRGGNRIVVLIDLALDQLYTLPVDGGYFRFFWSPDGNYLLVSHVLNDWLDQFDVVTMSGELVLGDVVVSAPNDGAYLVFDWVNDHQIIASVGTDVGFYDLTFFDLQTGGRRVLLPFLYSYKLSSDQRYVAALEQDTRKLIRFFDLASEGFPVEYENFGTEISNFIWRSDRLELIVLFDDRSLRGYDLEAKEWRDIATVPNEERQMRLVPCTH